MAIEPKKGVSEMRKITLVIFAAFCFVAVGYDGAMAAEARCQSGQKIEFKGKIVSVGVPGWNYMVVDNMALGTPKRPENVYLEHITNFEKWRDAALEHLRQSDTVRFVYSARCVEGKMVESTIESIIELKE